jgi:hypothetical protein
MAVIDTINIKLSECEATLANVRKRLEDYANLTDEQFMFCISAESYCLGAIDSLLFAKEKIISA